MEVRVYAEDPSRGFLPTGGTSLLLREPAGEGVRVDSSLVEGAPVGTTYDPMLSKVIAWGPDRTTALARLDRALADTVVLGVGTNTAFLRRLLAHEDVRAGRLDTGLVERSLEELTAGEVPLAALAAFALSRRAALRTGDDPWVQATGWRPGRPAPLRWDLDADGERRTLTLSGDTLGWGGRDGRRRRRRARSSPSTGAPPPCWSRRTATTTWVHVDGATTALTPLPPVRRGSAAGSADASVRSPMPGSVIAVHVASGDPVDKGTPLLVVEAMKMEHTLAAPAAGTAEVKVRVGDQVVVDQELAVVHPAEVSS